MGVSAKLVNFDELIRQSTNQPIIINDLASVTKDDRAVMDRLISTTYQTTDYFSNEPSCGCGKTRGGWLVGVQCEFCPTVVKNAYDQTIEPLLWMRSPDGVEALINPLIWTMLSKEFTFPKKGGFNLIEWLCNTDYQPTIPKPDELEELKEMGAVRGYNNFIQNFDLYIGYLFSLNSTVRTKRGKTSRTMSGQITNATKLNARKITTKSDLQVLIEEQRNSVMSGYIPLPNKTLLVIEETRIKTYVDPILTGAIEVIKTIPTIDDPLLRLSPVQKQNRTAKVLSRLAAFYYESYYTFFARKGGIYRKNIYGHRDEFSTRAVISSQTKAHKYDEVTIGWSQAVTMFKIHLTNKLLRLSFTPNQCIGFLQDYTDRYHPLLDRLLKELIAESPEKGIVNTTTRNPSLGRGSVQRMKITTIKTDVSDQTIGLSILDVNAFNAVKYMA